MKSLKTIYIETEILNEAINKYPKISKRIEELLRVDLNLPILEEKQDTQKRKKELQTSMKLMEHELKQLEKEKAKQTKGWVEK